MNTFLHSEVYLLLLGGDKSLQKREIRRAIQLARTLDNRQSMMESAHLVMPCR